MLVEKEELETEQVLGYCVLSMWKYFNKSQKNSSLIKEHLKLKQVKYGLFDQRVCQIAFER